MAVFRKITIIHLMVLTALFTLIIGSSRSLAETGMDLENRGEIVLSESDDMTRGNYVWMYKIENGYRYRRLYDKLNDVWIGDWILVGPV